MNGKACLNRVIFVYTRIRRCPSGDDPVTFKDETNCEGIFTRLLHLITKLSMLYTAFDSGDRVITIASRRRCASTGCRRGWKPLSRRLLKSR